MSQEGYNRYNPICLTLVFLFGSIIGSATTHSEPSLIKAGLVLILAATSFHLMHIDIKRLLQKVYSKK